LSTIRVDDWISEIVEYMKSINETVDLFIEFGRDYKNIDPLSEEDLASVILKFSSCIPGQSNLTTPCPYDNLRVHFGDFRKNAQIKSNVTQDNYIDLFIQTVMDPKSIFQKELSKIPIMMSTRLIELMIQFMETPQFKNLMESQDKSTHLMGRFMDIYLLARVLKDYPKNIIIYAGENHTIAYRYVLSKMGFTVKYNKNANVSRKCIDIDTLELPVFK
jgi:hypothetical protein